MPRTLGRDSACSIARSLGVLGDSWTLLIVRESMVAGATRFQEFREALGIAPNVLTKRLADLVGEGLMERRTYQEPGRRAREEYILTEAGRGLTTVLGALADWGRTYRPRPGGTSPRFTVDDSGAPARLTFVTEDGERVSPAHLKAHRAKDTALVHKGRRSG